MADRLESVLRQAQDERDKLVEVKLRNWIKKFAAILALLSVGTILGPVAIAGISASVSASRAKDNPLHPNDEAWLLMETSQKYHHYKTRGFTTGGRFPSPRYGKECGYEPNQLFPMEPDQFDVAIKEKRFTDEIGYVVLDRWRYDTDTKAYRSWVANALDEEHSQFRLGFLRRCIERTLARDVCYRSAKQLINSASDTVPYDKPERDPLPYFGFGIEDEIVCTYVEGVARRQGLAQPEK